MLVLVDTWFPGWIAEVDGRPRPILRANYLFRAVPVPVGRAVVRFDYRPRSLRIGAMLSACSLLLLLGLVLRAVGR